MWKAWTKDHFMNLKKELQEFINPPTPPSQLTTTSEFKSALDIASTENKPDLYPQVDESTGESILPAKSSPECQDCRGKMIELERKMKGAEEMEKRSVVANSVIQDLRMQYKQAMEQDVKRTQKMEDIMHKNEELEKRLEKTEKEKEMISEQAEETRNQMEQMLDEKTRKWKADMKLVKKNHSKLVDDLKKTHSYAMKVKASNFEEKLNTKMSEKDAEIQQMEQMNDELTETIRALQQKVRDLEEKSETDHLELAVKQSQWENELADKERVIMELQESRARQTAESDKAKEESQSKISMIISQLKDLIPSSPQDNMLLLILQKQRDIFRDDAPLKLAKEMVDKLIFLSNRPETHQLAHYEYEQYEGKVANYRQELEISIQKLNEKLPITAAPQFPSFSDRFMDKYWMEIDKSMNQEALDDECLICLVEITSDQELLKCDSCKKEVHMECGLEWLKVSRSCPHCRQVLLPPDEFPVLQ